jgi:serine/threonine-protein kinase
LQSTHDFIGKTLSDRFLITHVIGEGAMGIVYRGFDEVTLAEVAIKVLQPSLAVHPEIVARFQREAAAMRRVDHDGAVRVIGRGDEGGVPFIVMELLKGESLGSLLHRSGALPEARAARIMVQVCEALAVAHERGVVHRDIKPDKIMIVDGGPLGARVKILDFGVAKRVAARGGHVEDSFSSAEATRFGALVGTPDYMAPEQCAAAEIDARTDVYACGVLLYKMVTTHLPFEGETLSALDICKLHIEADPPPPRGVAPWVSEAMEAIILKALRKAPSDRHASAAALGDELAKLAAGHEEIAMEPTARFSITDIGAASDEITKALDVSALIDTPPSPAPPAPPDPPARPVERAIASPPPSTATTRVTPVVREYGRVIAIALVIGASVGTILLAAMSSCAH